MLRPHGKHSTLLCSLRQFAVLGDHPPVAVMLSPTLSCVFVSKSLAS